MKKLNFKKGFSLVELLVVITIIAILSVVAYTAVGGQTIKAKDSKRKQDINTIQSMAESYFVENSKYPASLTYCTGTQTPAANNCITKKHLSDIPKDPGAKKYDYVYKVSGSTYQIAATLEVDGDPKNYEAYVVGNGTDLIVTESNKGKYNNNGTLTNCNAGLKMKTGKIGIFNNADYSCVPYDPNN